MIDDYLYNEEVQLFPTPPKKSATNSILKQKEIRKQARRKSSKQLKNQRSRLLYQKQSYNRNLNKDFSGLFKENKKVETGVNSILKGVQDILGFVVIAGAALFSLQKILEKMGTLSEGQTAFDLLKPSTYDRGEGTFQGGQYKETDEKSKIKNKIIKEARSQGIDPAWALAIAEQESHFNPKAKSSVGAMGIFQLMPDTAKWLGVKDPWNVDQNIYGGVKYLKYLEKHYKGDKWKATAAYNRGQGNIDKDLRKGVDADTYTNKTRKDGKLIGYAQSVFSHYDNYKQDMAKLDEQALAEAKNTQTGTIADKYGGSFKGVGKVGNYTVKNDVIMSGQMEEFLKEVSSDYGGSGRVTSVMDGNMHKGKKNGWNAASHYSGNKADIGLRDVKDDPEAIIKQCVPIMRHPALVHIAFEGLGRNTDESVKISKSIVQEIRKRYPDIDKRIRGREFIVYHWGHKHSSAPHLDIRINPNKLKNVPKSKLQSNVNQENKNKPKEVPKTKPKNKVETKVKGQVQDQDITLQQSPQQKNTRLINLGNVDPNRLKYQENEDYTKKGK